MNAAEEPGHEAGIEATREDALVEALVVMCVAHLKEHGRLEEGGRPQRFQRRNRSKYSVGPARGAGPGLCGSPSPNSRRPMGSTSSRWRECS